MTFRTHWAAETTALGARIAASLEPPALVLLVGDLGVGKTTLAKGLIEALGAAPPQDVLSPTFSLVHEYEGDPKVYHLDLYRLSSLPELETLGLEDLWDQRAVVLVEWGEKFDQHLPGNRVEVRLEHAGGDARIGRVERGAAARHEPARQSL